MSFPRYEAYRDSGVEWLRDVPTHWSIDKFRHLFRESPEKINTEVVGPMISVSGYRGIEIKEYDDENRRRLDEELVGYRIVRVGQLVVNTMWLNYAGLGVSDHEGHVSPAYRSYWIAPKLDRRFVHYLMRSSVYVMGYTQLLTGIRPNSLQMSRDDLMSFPIVCPPRQEQAAVAAFLDRETAKIDALVEEQRGLIALLKEKRQAVISHAVTKGLDPTSPMKDSGVEWLGEVPAHWRVSPLMYLTQPDRPIMYGIVLPGPNVDDGIPIVKGGDVKPHRLKLDLLSRTTPEIEAPFARARLRPGDIVYSIRGTIGEAELVPQELLDANITQDAARIAPSKQTNNRWLAHAVRSMPVFVQLEQRSLGAAVRGINIFDLKRARVPVPPPAEQDAIADYLDRSMAALDDLRSEAEDAIDLLQERRSALISAAVTGKIDVRALTPAVPQTTTDPQRNFAEEAYA